METNIDIAWLRSWLAEAVRRAVDRGNELWEETQDERERGDFDAGRDIERWVDGIDDIGLRTELWLLNTHPSSYALDYIGQAMREISCVAGLQLRHTLDGTSLHDIVPSEAWADGYWYKGTLTIPADPVAVLRLVDTRLRSVIEGLRDMDVAIPGAEAYLEEAEARLATIRQHETTEAEGERAAVSGWEVDPDRDQRQRFRARRRGGSIQLEVQREGTNDWTELGAIPSAGAATVGSLLNSLRATTSGTPGVGEKPGRS